MTDDVLIYGDTERSPTMRHEIPLAIGDPFLYVDGSAVGQSSYSAKQLTAGCGPDSGLLPEGQAIGHNAESAISLPIITDRRI